MFLQTEDAPVPQHPRQCLHVIIASMIPQLLGFSLQICKAYYLRAIL